MFFNILINNKLSNFNINFFYLLIFLFFIFGILKFFEQINKKLFAIILKIFFQI